MESRIKLAFTTLGCQEWNLQDILRNASDMGFSGVDFRGYLNEIDIRKTPEFSSRISDTLARIEDSGLAVSALSSGARLCGNGDHSNDGDTIREMEDYADMAAHLNCGIVRVFGGNVGQRSYDEAVDSMAAMLRRAGEIGRAHGVVMALETHDDWIASVRIVDAFNAAGWPESTGILWDVHHPYRYRNESPQFTFDNIGRHVVYTHWKDSVKLPDGSTKLCPPGDGDIPLKEIFDVLRDGGYAGWYTLEWERRWHPELAPASEIYGGFVKLMTSFI